jgi:hypothetical protein
MFLIIHKSDEYEALTLEKENQASLRETGFNTHLMVTGN